MQRDDFREDKPVTRGQYRAIAILATELLGERSPASRYEATELLLRLQRTYHQQDVHRNGAATSPIPF